jgi:peptidyl-prolyl cis-trans isomerase D
MLDSFRKASKSWFAKGLLGLLILSFGAWGIGDFLTGGGGQTPAITVGDTPIGTGVLREELNREVSALRDQLGQDISTEQAIQFGFLDRAIGRVVTQATQIETARDWGMVVPDAVVARTIKADPNFAGEDGRFDRQLFERLLAANRLTESQFADQVRRSLLQTALSAPAAEAAHAPEGLVEDFDRHRNEARAGEVVSLSVADAPAPSEAPDEATLEQLYQDNLETFTAPEYRAVTAIVLTLAQARPLVTVSDEAIREAYHARSHEFSAPETRTVDQVVAEDEQTAQAVVDAVRAGRTLTDAAAEAGAPAPVAMGEVTPDTLPQDQSRAVFSVPEGQVSDPVESAFGWHVFHVRSVTPEATRPLEEVRDEIRAALVDEQAGDALYDLSVDLDDALGGGATLEEAAQALDLPLLSLEAVDRQGLGPNGTPVPDLPEAPAFLEAAYSAKPGEQTLMRETGTGYFVLRVDDVIPPAPRPLEDVRARVEALWVDQRKAEATRARAEAIRDAASEGRTFAGAAETVGATVEALPAVRRDGRAVEDGETPPPEDLARPLFTMNEDGIRIVDSGDVIHVLHLIEIDRAAGGTAETLAQTEQVLRESIADDLFVQFTDALSRAQGVEINRAVIESAFID